MGTTETINGKKLWTMIAFRSTKKTFFVPRQQKLATKLCKCVLRIKKKARLKRRVWVQTKIAEVGRVGIKNKATGDVKPPTILGFGCFTFAAASAAAFIILMALTLKRCQRIVTM